MLAADYSALGDKTMTIRRVTQRDSPATLAKRAARYEALLKEALSMAQHKAAREKPIVREILATAQVESQVASPNGKAASLSYRVARYGCSWGTIIPWEALEDTTPAAEADA